MTSVAALAAVAGFWLICPGSPRLRTPNRPVSGSAVLIMGAAAALLVTSMSRPTRAGLVLAVTLAGLGLGAVLRRQRRRRAALLVAERVLETCELLAAELGAGRPPGEALRRAAADWDALATVAESMSLGADVPEAFRRVADVDGAAGLRVLGAAWQIAQRTGHGLAASVEVVAGDLRADQATRRVVESELASARATARLVAILPVPALFMGGGAGGNPWGFLLGTAGGLTCLAAGLGLIVAGLWWIEAISSSVRATA